MQVFINNSTRFCYQGKKKKVLPSKAFGRMHMWTRKDKNGETYDEDLEKSSSDEYDSELDDKKDNDQSNEWFVKS